MQRFAGDFVAEPMPRRALQQPEGTAVSADIAELGIGVSAKVAFGRNTRVIPIIVVHP